MYKIVGVNGQQYGPVSAEQIRRWIAENRVNAQTLVQTEGRQDWMPLGSLAEFAAELKAVPPTIAPPPPAVASRAANKIPAGVCGILLGGFGVHKFILGYSGAGVIMLTVTLGAIFGGFLTCGLLWPFIGIMHLIGLIEGIVYLCKSDEDFVRTYVDAKKEWF
jgi:TM2 domain-containing membrane protein YozV